jgi:membrane protein DedA with SNARE-associated domain
MLIFVSLAFGTFVSEDLACVTAGLLIQRGEIGAPAAILACTLGIFIGDVGLWGVGRLFGRAVLAWPWVGRQVGQQRFTELRSWLERHAGRAIVASRFLPGTRLPLYLIAGVLELPAAVFATWALVGTLLWTPALVLTTADLGEVFTSRVAALSGLNWVPDVVIALVILWLLRIRRRMPDGDRGVDQEIGQPLGARSSG